MSNASINDLISDDVKQFSQSEYIPPVEPEVKKGFDLSFLKAPTGSGSVSEYVDHALNFNNSMGMARVLRGVTGLMGDLNLAIVDIVVGALDVLKTSKGANKNDIRNDGASSVS